MKIKTNLKTSFGGLGAVVVAALFLTACSSDVKKPGINYMPDMTYSNAYETYSASPTDISQNGEAMSARKPVEGTIPYGYIPNDSKIKTNQSLLMSYVMKNHFSYDVSKQDAERVRAGNEIQDPLEHTAENLAEGKRLYDINCSPCHGEKGEGNGQLIELPGGGDGPFTSRPQSYSKLLTTLKDGEVFYSVSYGKNMMGGYGFQLSVNERWQVIQYIKKLGGVGTATAAVVDSTGKQ